MASTDMNHILSDWLDQIHSAPNWTAMLSHMQKISRLNETTSQSFLNACKTFLTDFIQSRIMTDPCASRSMVMSVFGWSTLPSDLKLNVFEFLHDVKTLLNLCDVDQEARKLAKSTCKKYPLSIIVSHWSPQFHAAICLDCDKDEIEITSGSKCTNLGHVNIGDQFRKHFDTVVRNHELTIQPVSTIPSDIAQEFKTLIRRAERVRLMHEMDLAGHRFESAKELCTCSTAMASWLPDSDAFPELEQIDLSVCKFDYRDDNSLPTIPWGNELIRCMRIYPDLGHPEFMESICELCQPSEPLTKVTIAIVMDELDPDKTFGPCPRTQELSMLLLHPIGTHQIGLEHSLNDLEAVRMAFSLADVDGIMKIRDWLSYWGSRNAPNLKQLNLDLVLVERFDAVRDQLVTAFDVDLGEERFRCVETVKLVFAGKETRDVVDECVEVIEKRRLFGPAAVNVVSASCASRWL